MSRSHSRRASRRSGSRASSPSSPSPAGARSAPAGAPTSIAPAPGTPDSLGIARARLRRWPLFLVSFVEGGALMAVELLGGRVAAPYYGSSLYVWSSVLATTVGGLTIGYALGGRLSAQRASPSVLCLVVAASAVLVAILPFSAAAIQAATLGLDLRAGIVLSCAVFLLPPLIAFGMVSPLVIRLVADDLESVGRAAGAVYAISTAGGVLATFLFGFVLIPFAGMRASALATAAALALAAPIALLASADLASRREAELAR